MEFWNKNLILSEFGFIITWLSEATLEGTLKIITMIAGAATAIIFGIKTYYDMMESRKTYRDHKNQDQG